jgi:hypothetical protein
MNQQTHEVKRSLEFGMTGKVLNLLKGQRVAIELVFDAVVREGLQYLQSLFGQKSQTNKQSNKQTNNDNIASLTFFCV